MWYTMCFQGVPFLKKFFNFDAKLPVAQSVGLVEATRKHVDGYGILANSKSKGEVVDIDERDPGLKSDTVSKQFGGEARANGDNN